MLLPRQIDFLSLFVGYQATHLTASKHTKIAEALRETLAIAQLHSSYALFAARHKNLAPVDSQCYHSGGMVTLKLCLLFCGHWPGRVAG